MLMSMTSSHESKSISAQLRRGILRPALLQSTSRRPAHSTIAPAVAATASRSRTSAGNICASPPLETISSAIAASASALRPVSATRQPSRANRRAMAAPMPDPAPVIQTAPRSFLPEFAFCSGNFGSSTNSVVENRHLLTQAGREILPILPAILVYLDIIATDSSISMLAYNKDPLRWHFVAISGA